MISEKLQKGQLLIAEPSILGDLYFNRSVILLAEHSNEGSLGFIMNKPLEYTVNDLVPDVEASFKIYNGGPVEQDNLYFIHTIPELIAESVEISNGIYWGGDFELTKSLINEGKISKEDIRFFLGYTGWGANQLEEEIESNSWAIAVNKNEKRLLSTSSKEIWKEKITELGGDYLIWSNAPENPNLN